MPGDLPEPALPVADMSEDELLDAAIAASRAILETYGPREESREARQVRKRRSEVWGKILDELTRRHHGEE